jgi:hypothetical protein
VAVLSAKDLHRSLSPADDLDEILAWREQRTVTRNLTLHYDRMMLLLDPAAASKFCSQAVASQSGSD